MDLRAQLDAAHRRIAQLEKELEAYRKAHDVQSAATSSPASRTKVLTRSAAAALASQHAKSAKHRSSRPHDVITSSPSSRARSKSIHRKIEPKLESTVPAYIPSANQSCNELSSIESDVSKMPQQPLEKPIQPAPTPMVTANQSQFVPLQLKLSTEGYTRSVSSPAQIAAKMTTVNIFSASSSITTCRAPQSPTTSSNSKKANIAPKPTSSQVPKRHSVQATIAKSTRKERSGLVAKCTEPRQGQTRYWTEEEHERFLEAVAQYGEKAYVAISNYVETRTPKQVRTHAQKFQMKVARLARERCEAGEIMELPAGMLPISIGIDPSKVICTPPANATPMQVEAAARAASESEARLQAQRREAEQETRAQTEKKATTVAPSRSQVPTEASGVEHGDNKVGASPTSIDNMDLIAEAVSSVSDVTTEELTDPYLNYIGGETVRDTVSEFEECFAARLTKPWDAAEEVLDGKRKLPVLSAAVALMDSSVAKDDDLEDLEECGDLPMATLINFGI